MFGKYMKVAEVVLGCLAVGGISSAIDSAVTYKKKKIGENAVAGRSEETKKALAEAEEVIETVKKNSKEEKELFEIALRDFEDAPVETKIEEVRKELQAEMDQFRNANGTDAKVMAVKEEAASKIKVYRDQIGLDAAKEGLAGKTEEAELAYKTQKKLVEATVKDEEQAKAMKKTLKSYRDKVVEAEKEKIAKLEKKLERFSNDVNERAAMDISEIERPTNEKCAELNSIFEQKAGELRRKDKENRNLAWEKVKAERTEEVKEAYDNYEAAKLKKQTLLKKEQAEVGKMAREIDKFDALGEYLKNKGYGKIEVAAVAALPLLPVGHFVWFYISKLLKVLKAMS